MDMQGMETTELIITALVGVALLLFGYRIKKAAFFIVWFLIGYFLTTNLMPTINNLVPQIAENGLWQALLPIAGGLLLALLGFSIEKFCIAGICFGLVMIITIRYFGTEMPALAVGAIIGVIAGGAATALMKPATIIATSVAGSYAVTNAVLLLVTSIDQGVFYFPILIGLAIIGSLVQFSTTKHSS